MTSLTSPPSPDRSFWYVSTMDSIPDDKLPQCWMDDARMGFLFAAFYPRDTNPVGYDAKMRFWSEMLDLWCLECRRASFSLALLEKAFRRKNVRPQCLQHFVNELLRAGKIMTEDQFMSWDRTESWSTWAVKTVVKKPAVWSFNKLRESLIATDPSQVRYVYLGHLKNVGDRVFQNLEKKESNVIPFCKFREIVGDDTEHVLRWMKNNNQATEGVFSEERWIKVGKEAITENEVTKPFLKQEISRLYGLIDEYEASVVTLVESARENLRNQKRDAAKRCLKEKKLLEKKISDTSKKVDNLEAILNGLMDAQTNSGILNAYQLGISSLKSANSTLKEDEVANTMLELEEVLEETNDVTRSMAVDLGNDEELEEELRSILAANQVPQGDIAAELNLPDVPVAGPSPIKTNETASSLAQ